MYEVFVEENIKKGNTLQTVAFQPHRGISFYNTLANVLNEMVAKTEPQHPNNAVSGGSLLSTDLKGGITSVETNGESEPTISAGKGTDNLLSVQNFIVKSAKRLKKQG